MAFKNAAINGETAMLSNFDIVKECIGLIEEQGKMINNLENIIAFLVGLILSMLVYIYLD